MTRFYDLNCFDHVLIVMNFSNRDLCSYNYYHIHDGVIYFMPLLILMHINLELGIKFLIISTVSLQDHSVNLISGME